MSRPHPNPALAGIAAALTLGLAGCVMQPDIAAKVTTADGETIEVMLNTKSDPPDDGVVSIQSFQYGPWDMGADKPKALVATFIVHFDKGTVPASITVDDVSDTPIMRLFEDMHPKLVKYGLWAGLTKPYAPQDEHMNWMLTMDTSIRVYRFNITLTDGTKHSLLKAMFVPVPMKNVVKRQLGLPL
jgi:hypothetical protein